jgi:TonB family protein
MAKMIERDLKKRSVGCIGVSILIHAGVAATMVLAPQSSDLDFGTPTGNGGSGLVMIDGDDSASSAAAAAANDSAPIEVTTHSDAQALATTRAATEVVVVNTPAKPSAPPAEEAPKQLPPKAKPKAKTITAGTTGIGSTAPKEGDFESAMTIADDEGRTEDFMPTAPMEVTENDEDADDDVIQPAPVLQAKSVNESINDDTEDDSVKQSESTSAPAQTSKGASADTGIGTGSGSGNATGTRTSTGLSTAGAGSGSGSGSGIPVGVQIRDASKLVPASGNRAFVYPQQDRLKRREGTAWVVGRVTQQGSIAEVYLERSSGSKTMDDEAMRTFRTWKFMPGQEGYVRQPVQFVLQGEAEEVKATLRN